MKTRSRGRSPPKKKVTTNLVKRDTGTSPPPPKKMKVSEDPLKKSNEGATIISESHELEIRQDPMQASSGGVIIKDGGIPSTSSQCVVPAPDSMKIVKVQRVSQSRPFFHANVADWKYFGKPLRVDLGVHAIRLKRSNHLWHEIKQLSGKSIDIQHKLETANDPNDPVKNVSFEVGAYGAKRGKMAITPFATIKVNAKLEDETYFVFTIENQELADEHQVTIQTLRQACERAFDTIVMRCVEKDGHSQNMSCEYVDKMIREDAENASDPESDDSN